MREVIKRGRTVEEAVNEAARELGVAAEDVEVEVLSEPGRGFFGLLGAREAVVRARVRCSKGVYCARFVQRVGEHLGFRLKVSVREAGETAEVEAEGEEGADVGLLIGRRGETLEALQFLVNLAGTRATGDTRRIVVDVQGYRRRRGEALQRLAVMMAQRAVRQRREVVLRPMTARERRVIHLALKNHPRVRTSSRGEEPLRRVVITPVS